MGTRLSRRLAPLFALLAGLLLLAGLPGSAAAATCTGESTVSATPGRFSLTAVAGGEPSAGATILVRDTRSQRVLGRWQVDYLGRIVGRLADEIRATGIQLHITIIHAGGGREACSVAVPAERAAAAESVAAPARPAASPPAPPRTNADPAATSVESILATLFNSAYGAGYRAMHDTVRIPISFIPLSDDVFGAYNGYRIALNPRYAHNREGLAVVVAHELTHAWQDHEGRLTHPPSADPENCFQAEIEATVADARVWLSFYPNLRAPRDALDNDLNEVARLLLRSGRPGIEAAIRETYVGQCYGSQFGLIGRHLTWTTAAPAATAWSP